jgi:hypothetical protein
VGYQTTKFSIQPQVQPKIWPSTPSLLNGGLNLVDKEYKLPENQTPKVLNMWYKNGELGIRDGQNYLNAAEVVEPICYGAYDESYLGYYIKHCGTKLYKQDVAAGVSTAIFSGLNASKSSLFKFNGKIYLKQVGHYVVWDGTAASEVVPYEPTVIINRMPTGGGDANENYNRYGKCFKNAFITDGIAVAFTLTDIGLDATQVTASIDGGNTWSLVEGTNLTVNRTTGVVTMSVAPATNTNIFRIKAYKTVQTDIDGILNCLAAMPFGGTNDNRLFIGNNGTGYFYYTGITTAGVDATYFAYNNYNIVGLTDENITAFVKSFDVLTIHKESGEIYGETYSFDGTKGVFNTFPLASKGGCDCPNTIEVVNNNPVWLNSKMGVCVLAGTTVGSQRNVFQISRNIDPRLLVEPNLDKATAIEYGGKYWLCVNDKVYLWDYFSSPYYDTGNPEESAKRLSWWYFDSINSGAWLVDDVLMYVNRDTGLTVRFADNWYDFGEKIEAIYRYPIRQMGNGIYEFDVLNGWIGVRGDTRTAYKVTYITSDDFNGDPATEQISTGSFSWSHFTWANFTWNVMGPLYNWELSPYEKGIRYFGVEFANVSAGTDMNISSMEWRYKVGKMIR